MALLIGLASWALPHIGIAVDDNTKALLTALASAIGVWAVANGKGQGA